ncbi:MAG: hypothetical protein WAU91_11040 [Desulfatitalea sp.]
MSTILRSLKKLEKEKQSHIDPAPAPGLISTNGANQAIHRAAQFAWFKDRVVLWSMVGVACLIVVAGLYAFNRPAPQATQIAAPSAQTIQTVPKMPPPNRSVQPRPINVPPSVAAADEPTLVKPDASASMPTEDISKPKPMAVTPSVAPPLPTDGFESLGHKPAPSTMGAAPFQKHARPDKAATRPAIGPTPKTTPAPIAPPVAAAAPVQQHVAAPIEVPIAAAAPGQHSPAPAASPPEPSEQPKSQPASAKQEANLYANAERMTNGALKVQAIVFAPTAEERMAVVNNNIVREGSAVDSYTIVGIGEEAVYVREGQGRLLKVPFGKQ